MRRSVQLEEVLEHMQHLGFSFELQHALSTRVAIHNSLYREDCNTLPTLW